MVLAGVLSWPGPGSHCRGNVANVRPVPCSQARPTHNQHYTTQHSFETELCATTTTLNSKVTMDHLVGGIILFIIITGQYWGWSSWAPPSLTMSTDAGWSGRPQSGMAVQPWSADSAEPRTEPSSRGVGNQLSHSHSKPLAHSSLPSLSHFKSI